jgi:hypothetical protein
MEYELGVRLLLRSAAGVRTMDAGLTLYRHARIVLRQMQEIEVDVVSEEGGAVEPTNAGRGNMELRHLRYFVAVPRSCISPAQPSGLESNSRPSAAKSASSGGSWARPCLRHSRTAHQRAEPSKVQGNASAYRL